MAEDIARPEQQQTLFRPSHVELDERMQAMLAALGFPAWQADGLLEEFAMYRRGEAAGVEPGVREALGRPPRSFDEFARDYASLFA
jgi:hypothetical protein